MTNTTNTTTTNATELYLFPVYNEKNPVICNKKTWIHKNGTVELCLNEREHKRIYVSLYDREYIGDVEDDFLATNQLTDEIYDAILDEEITIEQALEEMRKLNLAGDFQYII